MEQNKDEVKDKEKATDELVMLLSNSEGKVSLKDLIKRLNESGLQLTDPRLAETKQEIDKVMKLYETSGEFVDRVCFGNCVRENISLVRKALKGNFVISQFQDFCARVNDTYENVEQENDKWAVALCTIDGQQHSIGDHTEKFTMQSGCNPFNYALLLDTQPIDFVHTYIGRKLSLDDMNTLDKKPPNPLIDSSAIIVASMLRSSEANSLGMQNKLSGQDSRKHSTRHDPKKLSKELVKEILKRYQSISGDIGLKVYTLEEEESDLFYGIAHIMKHKDFFPTRIFNKLHQMYFEVDVDIQDTMNFYNQMRSIQLNAIKGAVMAATLANGGKCPITRDQALDPASVRNTLSMMHLFGMGEYSCEFACKVGVPAMSAESGVIFVVVPEVMGICVWSPQLDKYNNSTRGVEFCELLSTRVKLHLFDRPSETLPDPREKKVDKQAKKKKVPTATLR